MLTVIYLIMAAIHLVFTVYAVRLWLRNRSIYTGLAAAVLAGLFYDNFIIGIGAFIGEGSLLQSLNWLRFAIHAFLTPTLIMFVVAIAIKFGVEWAKTSWAYIAFGILTLLMIGLGVYVDIIQLDLAPILEDGTLRYAHAESAGPPIPAIVTIIVMMIIGVFVWRTGKWSVLFLGSLAMFILAGAGASILVLSNIGEVLFAGSIVSSDYKADSS